MTVLQFSDGVNIQLPESSKFKPLIVGDLHISDKDSPRHRNYFESCTNFLNDITETIRREEITHLFLLGDLVGRTTEKNFQRRETMLYFSRVLQLWNSLTGNNVYAVEGNHDRGRVLTDFQFFVELGLIKTPRTLDVGCTRFHFIAYGEHTRKIEFSEDHYNVALMHSHLTVDGQTTWLPRTDEEIELSTLHNLEGVEMVICGHIHEPSFRPVKTAIRGKEITLFYPGCGTRPKYERKIWDKVFGVVFHITDDMVDLSQVEFQLEPAETFFSNFLSDEEVEALADAESDLDRPSFDMDELLSILKELKDYNLMGEADYKTHLLRMGALDKEATDLAMKYIEDAEGVLK